MRGWFPDLTVHGRRAGYVLLALAAGGVDLIVWKGDRDLRFGGLLPVWIVPAGAAATLAVLLYRRRYPLAVFGVEWIYTLIALPVPKYQPFACLFVALHAVAARAPSGRARLALVACALPFGVFSHNFAVAARSGAVLDNFLLATALWAALGGGVWGLGRLSFVNEQRARENQRRALEAERLRLARELHDSVTGSVTAMLLHAAGARAHLSPTEGTVRDALRVIEQTAAQAMNELHRMLGLLREPDAGSGSPTGASAGNPGLSALDELLDRHRLGGFDVTLLSEGASRAIDPSVDQAAYRMVQESLTNAVKHGGPGTRVSVRLAWLPDQLHVDVRSGGGEGPTGAVVSSGYGLVGLRERVSLVGGTLNAGSVRGGWLVQAELPLTGERSPPRSGDGVAPRTT